jgi:hypothetical protein
MMEYHLKNRKEVEDFIKNEVLTTSEVKEILNVTRQRLHALVSSEKLKPIKRLRSESLFLRADVEHLQEELKELRKKYRPYDAE